MQILLVFAVMLADLHSTLRESLLRDFDAPPEKLGVAVSGGGDSLALIHLLHEWAKTSDVVIHAITVDHGLRPESRAEAETVAKITGDLGIVHHIATWKGWNGQGNLQDQARMARRNLIEDWAKERGIDAVLTGHTRDDQAETVLMRLFRGSGVDGLAAMAQTEHHGVQWLRPLLDAGRADLRAYLAAIEVEWIDDPSNDDLRFDRIKARELIAAVPNSGSVTKRLAETARHMQAAQDVLDTAMRDLAVQAVTQIEGDLLIKRAKFDAAPQDTRTRLLARALMWVSSAPYRPRFSPLLALLDAGKGTLHGCQVTSSAKTMRIAREYQAVRQLTCATTGLWDGRWIAFGPHQDDLRIAPLGAAGDKSCPNRAESGFPAVTRQASPAIFRENKLVAAPFAGFSNGWRVELAQNAANFMESLLTH